MTILIGSIKQRIDTAANWATANPILAAGEEGLEAITGKRKIGNGVTSWNTLTYHEKFTTPEKAKLAVAATLLSPEFTGVPTAPTAMAGNSNTQIANTAFVQAAIADIPPSYTDADARLAISKIGTFLMYDNISGQISYSYEPVNRAGDTMTGPIVFNDGTSLSSYSAGGLDILSNNGFLSTRFKANGVGYSFEVLEESVNAGAFMAQDGSFGYKDNTTNRAILLKFPGQSTPLSTNTVIAVRELAGTMALLSDIPTSYTDGDARLAISVTGSLLSYDNTTGVFSTQYTAESIANKGIAGGYAPLDGAGKVATSHLPDSILGAVKYQGVWNASTNTPMLSDGRPKGEYYVVDVAGSTSLDGITDWKVGDWVISNGATWDKVDNTDKVSSVNGYQGVVSLTKSDIGLGNVENTSLTTWAGSANITTVGSIGSGVWNGTAIAPVRGGTGLTTYTTGDLLFASATNVLSKLAIGVNGLYLKSNGVTVEWATVPSGYTDAQARASISSTSPVSYNSTTGVISMAPASSTVSGYLTSADWNTFNNKASALSYIPLDVAGSNAITGSINNSATGYFQVPSGTTAQQPVTPANGMVRYNSTTGRMEFYSAAAWRNFVRLEGDTMTGPLGTTILSVGNIAAAVNTTVTIKGTGTTLGSFAYKTFDLSSVLTSSLDDTGNLFAKGALNIGGATAVTAVGSTRIGTSIAWLDVSTSAVTIGQACVSFHVTQTALNSSSAFMFANGFFTYLRAPVGGTVALQAGSDTALDASTGYISFNSGSTTANGTQFRFSNQARFSQATLIERHGMTYSTYTKTWLSVGPSLNREILIEAPTYAAGATTTMATAATFVIGAAPIAGSLVTITNPLAFWIQSGNAQVDGNIRIGTAAGIFIKEDTNGTSGIATLVDGVVVVNTSKVTANSRIQLTGQGGNNSNLGTYNVTARTAGTSFTITSTNVLDTNTVAWLIIEKI